MDASHAFVSGPAFIRREIKPPSFFARILKRLLSRYCMMKRTPWDIWTEFEKSATPDASCLLGPNAYAISSKRSIRLGARTVCRGILRCENFGDGKIQIGDDVYIGDDVLVSSSTNIAIGSRTLIAHGVHIFDNSTHPLQADHRFSDWQYILGIKEKKPAIDSAEVQIGEDCWIGFNSMVMKGVQLGRGTVVAAGSVVTKSFPENSLLAGSPARLVREISQSERR